MLNTKMLLIAAGVSVAVGFSAGWKVANWRADSKIHTMTVSAQEAKDEATRKVADLEEQLRDQTRLEAEIAALRERDQKIVTKYVDREVFVYAQNPDIEHCELSNGFVRIHDTGASGSTDLPETSGSGSGIDASPSGIEDTEALAVITQNYATCHEIRNQLLSLQGYVSSLQNVLKF